MNFAKVLAQLNVLKRIMATNADDTVAYHQAGQTYDAMLFEKITFREYVALVKQLGRGLTTREDANLIVYFKNKS